MQEEVVIYERAWLNWLVVSLAATVLSIFVCLAFLSKPYLLQLPGFYVVLFFYSVLLGYFLKDALTSQPRLKLSEVGIFDRKSGAGWIEWNDTTHVYSQRFRQAQYVTFRVVDASKYLCRMGPIKRFGSKLNGWIGIGPLYIQTNKIAIKNSTLETICLRMIQPEEREALIDLLHTSHKSQWDSLV
jgi:hypothetical protein